MTFFLSFHTKIYIYLYIYYVLVKENKSFYLLLRMSLNTKSCLIFHQFSNIYNFFISISSLHQQILRFRINVNYFFHKIIIIIKSYSSNLIFLLCLFPTKQNLLYKWLNHHLSLASKHHLSYYKNLILKKLIYGMSLSDCNLSWIYTKT